MPGNCQGFNIGTLTPVRFSVVKGGAKSRVVTISLSPQGMAYTRALKSEKSLSTSIPVGGGAVDTNDWCITITDDLDWGQHISEISAKATKTMGFLRRNLAIAPRHTKEVAYKTLVHPKLEYAAPIWHISLS